MLTSQVTFPGIDNIVGARFTASRGAFPGKGTLTILPQDNFAVGPGTMVWQTNEQTLVFPYCTLALNHLKRREQGPRSEWRWEVTVYDRRLLWWNYKLDANWNERWLDGTIKDLTKKNAQEIAKLILDVLGETGATVADVPTNLYPRCCWNGANAAAALQWLCEWCSIAIGFDNQGFVQLRSYGEGDELPDVLRLNPVYRYGLAATPANLQALSGPTVYQSPIQLTDVGINSDDATWIGVNGVDYVPTAGWFYEPWTNFGNVDAAQRFHPSLELGRIWRIASLGGPSPPGTDTNVDDINQLLPLKPVLAKPLAHEEGAERNKIGHFPYVQGIFWFQGDLRANCNTVQRWPGNFTLYHNLGLIVTEYPVFDLHSEFLAADDSGLTLRLWLMCAYNVRGTDGKYDRLLEEQGAGGPYGTKVLIRPEVFGAYIDGGDDTRPAARDELTAYLRQFGKRYSGEAIVAQVYEGLGFVATALDGLIAQVTLEFGYGAEPRTIVSTGYEHDTYNESFEECLRKSTLQLLASTQETAL